MRTIRGSAPAAAPRVLYDSAKDAAILRTVRREETETYRLEGCGAVVAILALGALLAACTASGNVWVVRLLAVGHGGRSNGSRGV